MQKADDMHGSRPFYIGDLSILGLGYLWGFWNQTSTNTKGSYILGESKAILGFSVQGLVPLTPMLFNSQPYCIFFKYNILKSRSMQYPFFPISYYCKLTYTILMCYRLNCVSQNSYVEALTFSLGVIRDRAFKEVIKVR